MDRERQATMSEDDFKRDAIRVQLNADATGDSQWCGVRAQAETSSFVLIDEGLKPRSISR